MPLTFDVKEIDNYEVVTTKPHTRGTDKQEWHPVTEVLVFLSMACGYNKITKENAKEVYERVNIYQVLSGAPLASSEGDIWLTLEDVEMHIGLKTNASPTTKAEFFKLVRRWLDLLRSTVNDTIPKDGRDRSAYEVFEYLHACHMEGQANGK
jgi:hypothetical protein